MCGIVGYIGKRDALPVLLDGLKRLEYRGYDSAGIAIRNGEGVEICKTEGRIADLELMLPNPAPFANMGLGHTRWATHGKPSSLNAHPHASGGIVVVHNGIIENYMELKKILVAEKHEFHSETDTEVIPQMILRYVKRGMSPEIAIKTAVSLLRGSYAIGILFEDVPGTIYAVRKGSPLVLGIGNGEFLFASDIPAILPYTNDFIFLEDGHFCRLTQDGFQLELLNGSEPVQVSPRIVHVDWTLSMAEKEGYGHFMLKEIYEQPRGIMDTLREWTKNPLKLLPALGLDSRHVLSLKRFQIVACGTSYHAGLVGKYMIEKIAHIPVDVDIASEYRYRELPPERNSFFISITQSGETADTLAAQREAKKRGAATLAICNVVGSTASREADHVLYTRAGPEIGVASTKTFTAQLSALFLLMLALGIKRNRISRTEADNLLADLKNLSSLVEKTLECEDQIKKLSLKLHTCRDFLYLGRGLNYPIALEGALKLKEISYIHAEGYAAGEMKHGPIALIEEGVPVVVLSPADALFEKTLSNMEEVKARGGMIIAVTDRPEALAGKADHVIGVPASHPVLSPFITIIPLQLLAYHIAVLRGCDVDKPRNLAKSVTVE